MRAPDRRHRSRLRADFSGDDRAVSETLGNIMLIALTVAMLGAFGALVISSVTSDTPTPPSATFLMEAPLGSTTVDVRHLSGSTLVVGGSTLLLTIDGTQVVASSTLVSPAVAGEWAPGETLRFTVAALAAGARVVFFAADETSGKMVGTAYATVPSATAYEDTIGTNDLAVATAAPASAQLTETGASTIVRATLGSNKGLALMESVRLDATSIEIGVLDMRDDGIDPDVTANDGEYAVRIAAPWYIFDALAADSTRTLTVTATDVTGHTATRDTQVTLVKPGGTATVPTAVQDLAAAPGVQLVTLTWGPPSSDGGSTITSFDVYQTAPTSTFIANVAAPGGVWTSMSYDVTGRTAGVLHSFQVYAKNAVGVGPASNTASATPTAPVGVPAAVTNLAATAGLKSVPLTWTAPSDGGSPLTGYEIWMTSPTNVLVATTTNGGNVSFTVNSLSPDVAYTFTIKAKNSVGTGPSSNAATATPFGINYAAASSTAFAYGSVSDIANLARDNSGDVATLTESNAPGALQTIPPTTAAQGFDTSIAGWQGYGVTAGKGLPITHSASGGNPGGALVATQVGSGNAQGNLDYRFTVTGATTSDISISFQYKFSNACGANRFLQVFLVAPDNLTVTQIGASDNVCSANTWKTFTGTATGAGFVVGEQRLRLVVNQQQDGNTFTLDNIVMTYNAAGDARFGHEFSISGLPSAPTRQLQIQHGSIPGESLIVQVWDGSAWTTRGTLPASSGVFTASLATADVNAGVVLVRLQDQTTSSDSALTSWTIGYIRLESFP